MRIFHEKIDNEDYVDILIDKKDIEHIEEFFILQQPVYLNGQITNLGVKLNVEEFLPQDG